ncbi:MAG TPA: hypothetical protein VLT84_12080, partial [Acidobacteriota bacterium]|nr:hypothetical protein [Acidobacteriota bacterium]
RAFAMFATSVALGAAGLFDTYTSHLLTPLWTIAIAVAGGALFNLAAWRRRGCRRRSRGSEGDPGS